MKLAVALVIGASIAYFDNTRHWDDTGVIAFVLALAAAVFGYLGPAKPWLWAIALGVWIPLIGIIRSGNYSSLMALGISLLGAYFGKLMRTSLAATQRANSSQ